MPHALRYARPKNHPELASLLWVSTSASSLCSMHPCLHFANSQHHFPKQSDAALFHLLMAQPLFLFQRAYLQPICKDAHRLKSTIQKDLPNFVTLVTNGLAPAPDRGLLVQINSGQLKNEDGSMYTIYRLSFKPDAELHLTLMISRRWENTLLHVSASGSSVLQASATADVHLGRC
jgi:hypothetical protein